MKMLKSLLWFLITLCLDAAVYYDKIYKVESWYLDNLIKIYFLYYIVGLILVLVGVVALASYNKGSFIKVTTSSEKFIITSNEFKKWYSKIIRYISIIVDIGFGVIGCWWFFVIGILRQIFVTILRSQIKDIVENIIKTQPELKEKFEVKEKRSKYSFIKIS